MPDSDLFCSFRCEIIVVFDLVGVCVLSCLFVWCVRFSFFSFVVAILIVSFDLVGVRVVFFVLVCFSFSFDVVAV